VTADLRTANVWMVGGGIASMAAAAFLIRDAGLPGENIPILETLEVLKTIDVTTVMMPYASALFSRRIPEDRPKVLPDRAANFAFLGQFTDLPEDVVFTVEYSVHGAMHAVYQLFGVDMEIPPSYHGLLDPKVQK
jgi:myosin-crossreactive antigen